MTVMNRDSYRRSLFLASQNSSKTTTYPPRGVASFEPIFFGFGYLTLNHEQFALPQRGSKNKKKKWLYDSLLAIYEILKELSKFVAKRVEQENGSGYSRCHYVHKNNKNRLIELGLDPIEEVSGQNLFQLGINDDKERIIGFFSKSNPGLFEVCILDLNHITYS